MMDWQGYTKRDAAVEIGGRHDLVLASDPERGRERGRPAAVVHRGSLGSGSGQAVIRVTVLDSLCPMYGAAK